MSTSKAIILRDYFELLGAVPDGEIARRVGCSQPYVTRVRREAGIAALSDEIALRQGAARRLAATRARLEAHPGWSDPAVSDTTLARDCRASRHTVQRLRSTQYAPAVVAAGHPGWHDPAIADAAIVAETGLSRRVVRAHRVVRYVRQPRPAAPRPERRKLAPNTAPLLALMVEAPRTYGELTEILGRRPAARLLRAALHAGLVFRLARGLYALSIVAE